ncbi:MAG: metal-dependent transcriptional regulator [Chloroflexaceae bacterium]|nr:metal-dependent transcriptional regulator [Chloroflexaceae bacterium]
MSESTDMYLVTTALLRKGNEPVPLSLLANHLSISPVSTNEMCRKLEERGLIEYQPYKGVTLTDEGETLARRVLGRRRLWEVFLVERLEIEVEEATAIACQLEHISSDRLVEALATFLKQPSAQPPEKRSPFRLLSSFTAGQRGRVEAVKTSEVTASFLHAQGVEPGTVVEVLAVGGDGALFLAVEDHRNYHHHDHRYHHYHTLSLARTVADGITMMLLADQGDNGDNGDDRDKGDVNEREGRKSA